MQGWIDIPVGLRHARVGLKFDLNIRKPFKKLKTYQVQFYMYVEIYFCAIVLDFAI